MPQLGLGLHPPGSPTWPGDMGDGGGGVTRNSFPEGGGEGVAFIVKLERGAFTAYMHTVQRSTEQS
jgi:hypothetical protein